MLNRNVRFVVNVSRAEDEANMAFGEYCRKYTSPANRPKPPSQRNRAAGMWIVIAVLSILLVLLLSTGCPPLVT